MSEIIKYCVHTAQNHDSVDNSSTERNCLPHLPIPPSTGTAQQEKKNQKLISYYTVIVSIAFQNHHNNNNRRLSARKKRCARSVWEKLPEEKNKNLVFQSGSVYSQRTHTYNKYDVRLCVWSIKCDVMILENKRSSQCTANFFFAEQEKEREGRGEKQRENELAQRKQKNRVPERETNG